MSVYERRVVGARQGRRFKSKLVNMSGKRQAERFDGRGITDQMKFVASLAGLTG
jgi:hypothetical protein